MEFSSEDSFTWTHTSTDSIASVAMTVGDVSVETEAEPDTRHGKRKKSKKHLSSKQENRHSHELTDKHDLKHKFKVEMEQSNYEEHNRKEKLIKMEPESDCDGTKYKKKIKQDVTISNDDESHDEKYLNSKVKQEILCDILTTHKTKKKNKHSHFDALDSNTSETHENEANFNSLEQHETQNSQYNSSSKVKKKKSKKKRNREDQLQAEIEDVMDMDVPYKCAKSEMTISMKSDSFIQDDISQEETNCSEISAIQGDEDQVSIADSETGKKNKKEINSLYKNTILNKFNMDRDPQIIHSTETTTPPTISERIMFEEDYAELNTNNENKASKLKKFLKVSSQFQLISKELPRNLILTNDDDIWILKCPKQIDIQDFYGIELQTESKCKIKLNGQRYDVNLEEHNDTATVLSMNRSKYEIKNLPLCGRINIRKRIPKAHFSNDNIMANNQTNFIPLPETKCRHPLFGSNYKKAIKIPAVIAQRLKPNNENEDISIKKKKKKNRTEKLEPEIEIKKKKRKLIEDENPAPKRLKKIKHDPESAEAWSSEKAIEQNLFDF